MIFLTNVNLNQNQLMNAVIQPLAVAPTTPVLGQIYCNSVTSRIMFYNGTEWKVVGVVVESSATNGSIVVDGVTMNVYTLPVATVSTLGGVKVGQGLVVDSDGVLSVGSGGVADAVEWSNVLNKPPLVNTGSYNPTVPTVAALKSAVLNALELGTLVVHGIYHGSMSSFTDGNGFTGEVKYTIICYSTSIPLIYFYANGDGSTTKDRIWFTYADTSTGNAVYELTNKEITSSDLEAINAVVDANYVHTDNNLTNELLTKLNNIAENANNYVLPAATVSTLGGIIPDDSTLKVSAEGILSVATNGHTHTSESVTGLAEALNLKAPLESPALTGTPTAPTPVVSDNSTQIATTNFVKTALETYVNSIEAHVTVGTINGNGVIQSVNSSVLTQTIIPGTTTIAQLTEYQAGWEFRVLNAGTINNIGSVNAGDWLVCLNDYNTSYKASDWTTLSMNLDVTNTVIDDESKIPTSAAVFDYAQPISQTLTDISTSAGVDNAHLANMPANTLKGNNGETAGSPSDLTAEQVRILLGSPRKYTATNSTLSVVGGNVSWTINHNLGTTDVIVQVYDTSNSELILVDVSVVSTNSVTLSWVSNSNIETGLYKVVIIG